MMPTITPNRPSALRRQQRPEKCLCAPQGAGSAAGDLMHACMWGLIRHAACARKAHLPKISTTRILTNSVEFCASESAQLLPTIPTHMLQA